MRVSARTLAEVQPVFRCDGSARIGFGHISRCLALATALKSAGALRSRFVSRDLHPLVRKKVLDAGYEWQGLPWNIGSDRDLRQTILAASGRRCVLFTDSHSLSESYYEALVAAGIPVVSFDDNAEVRFASHIVINHNIAAPEYRYRTARHTRLMLGLKYLPLRTAFQSLLDRQRRIRKNVRNVVVTLGGVLQLEPTLRVLRGLRDWANRHDVRVTLIVGLRAPNRVLGQVRRELPRLGRLVVDPSDFVHLIWGADIALVNGSVTAYEGAALGTPLIVMAVDKNQRQAVIGFEKCRAAVTLRTANGFEAESVGAAVSNLAADMGLRSKLSRGGQRLVDGRGAERIIGAVATLLRAGAFGAPKEMQRD